MSKEIFFHDVVEIDKWQKIQDHLAQVLGVTITTVGKQRECLTSVSTPSCLCKDAIKTIVYAMLKCDRCDVTELLNDIDRQEREWKDGVRCPFGFYAFYIPLCVDGKIFANFFVGPVILGKRLDDVSCMEGLKKLGIDNETVLDAVKELKPFTFYGMKSIIELLRGISCYIIRPGDKSPGVNESERKFTAIFDGLHDFYREKLLNSLLEVSFDFTKAQKGSLMLFNEKAGELYIKTAKGIPGDIIDKTRVRIGEGIAGMVAGGKTPLFIDDNITDHRIKEMMNKPDIKASMSLPIRVSDRLLGVLNISTLKLPCEEFSQQSMATITSLVKLVESALKDFPENPG